MDVGIARLPFAARHLAFGIAQQLAAFLGPVGCRQFVVYRVQHVARMRSRCSGRLGRGFGGFRLWRALRRPRVDQIVKLALQRGDVLGWIAKGFGRGYFVIERHGPALIVRRQVAKIRLARRRCGLFPLGKGAVQNVVRT
ncbi:hypothetical protein D3C80_1728720 [compost metagenome]